MCEAFFYLKNLKFTCIKIFLSLFRLQCKEYHCLQESPFLVYHRGAVCRWIGPQHFQDWIDYIGIVFFINFTIMRLHLFGILGVSYLVIKIQAVGDLKMRRLLQICRFISG